jgi:hypothetical protein
MEESRLEIDTKSILKEEIDQLSNLIKIDTEKLFQKLYTITLSYVTDLKPWNRDKRRSYANEIYHINVLDKKIKRSEPYIEFTKKLTEKISHYPVTEELIEEHNAIHKIEVEKALEELKKVRQAK